MVFENIDNALLTIKLKTSVDWVNDARTLNSFKPKRVKFKKKMIPSKCSID